MKVVDGNEKAILHELGELHKEVEQFEKLLDSLCTWKVYMDTAFKAACDRLTSLERAVSNLERRTDIFGK